MRPHTRHHAARLAAALVLLLTPATLLAGPAAAATPAQQTTATATTADVAPSPDVLAVDFADRTPADRAQQLAPVVKGAPQITGDPGAGKPVATFNGTSDAYTYPFAGQWSKLTGGFTVGCRFRWNGATVPASGQKAICSNAQSGGADLQIDSGQLAFSVNAGGYKYTHAPIVAGRWYDAVATWDGQSVKLYVDGVLASATAAPGALTVPTSGAQNWTLGADSASAGGIETPSPVSISTADVWTGALTAGQVAAFSAANGAPPAGAPDCTAYEDGVTGAVDAPVGTVVLDEDFSGADALDCWNQATGSEPWTVAGGRLTGRSPAAGDQPVLTFGPHLDDYLLETTARFDQVLRPDDPWFALIADTPVGGVRPFPAFAVRSGTTTADGVRAFVQSPTTASALAGAPLGTDLGTGTDARLALEVHGRTANFYVDDRLVLAGVPLPRTATGVTGLCLDSAAVSFDDLRLTKLGPLGTTGFMTDTFRLPAAPVSASVRQPLAGLWKAGWTRPGGAKTVFRKVSGDSWLDVGADGVVTGTAPAEVPQDEGALTVRATDGTTTADILLQVPVSAAGAAPQLQSASWNAWDGGSHVTDAVAKNVAVIATQGITLAGFQDGGAAMAREVGAALGWDVYASGDLGIVSAYPIADADRVAPTGAAPAAAVTLDVAGMPVRVWNTHLDETDYGPYRACFDAATDLAAHERTTTRYAQARAVAQEMAADLSGDTPVLLLGDLASPSADDWTASTGGSHCGAGAVDWPVPDVFASLGLIDSYRVANPDPDTDPGITWSPVTSAHANGEDEPQDRIDYVWYAGDGLHVDEAHALTVGWPSEDEVADNSWASDHAAAVTTFTLGESDTAPAPELPVVSVDRRTVAYQAGHGPVDAAAFLTDAGATADPAEAVLRADLSGVDFAEPGWYTVLVTAVHGRYTSDPVAATVRVAPRPGLVLSATTAAFTAGDTVDEAAVLARLQPVLDVPGTVRADLTAVKPLTPGRYQVAVTATDEWGFTVTLPARVEIAGVVPTVWSPAEVYDSGDTVSYGGALYQAFWWTRNQPPGDPYGPWQEIALAEDGTAVWTASRIFRTDDVAVHQGRTYRARWYTRNQAPGDPYGPWVAVG
ncbi:LamG-like jellyroll fold domain-containing protein [Streptomyces sp. NPDC060198]|uniref:LamG-like jellyroll fold domain-containing protein n=1 Tax=Streptomyces sp. NPDC060198 TaxID=3347070 RepID=UPI0036500D9C